MTATTERPTSGWPSAQDEAAVISRLPYGQLVGGRWQVSRQESTFDVHDPATTQLLATVDCASSEDVTAAIDATVAAQDRFALTSPRERADLLLRAYSALLAREDEFALLITLEMGKPLAEARAEVRYAADFLRWFAEESPRASGEQRLMPDGGSRMLVLPRPVGPCLLVTPWNFPIAMATRKIAPAIAAGCTSIVKPAEETPLTTLLFATLLQDVGLPDGVVNVITTDDPAPVVSRLLADGRLRKLSFTGSTSVGQLLLRQAAEQVMRTSMELGGNAPFLVFADADIPAAVQGFLIAKLRNGGEACTAANRLFVHREVAEEFLSALREQLKDVRIGRGTDPASTLGPMINAAAATRLAGWVADAVDARALVVIDGPVVPDTGHFITPMVLANVPLGASLTNEEVFGPIVGLTEFDDEAAVISAANSSRYGLVAYVYTRDLKRAMRLLERLQFGMIGLNRGIVSNAAAPFGGIKHSGLGREGSHEGLHEYQDIVYAAMDV